VRVNVASVAPVLWVISSVNLTACHTGVCVCVCDARTRRVNVHQYYWQQVRPLLSDPATGGLPVHNDLVETTPTPGYPRSWCGQ